MQVAIIISNNQRFLSSQSLAKEIFEITKKPIIYISLCRREYILPDDYDELKSTKYKYIARITYLMDILQSSYNENYFFRISSNVVGKKFTSFLEREEVGGLITLQPDICYMKASFNLLITLRNIRIPILVMVDRQYTPSFMTNHAINNFCTLLITDPIISLEIYSKYNISNKIIILTDEEQTKNIKQMQNHIKYRLLAKERKHLATIIGANLKYNETVVNILRIFDDASYLIMPICGIYQEDNIDNHINLVINKIAKNKQYLIKFIFTDNSIIYLSEDTLVKYKNKNIFQANTDIIQLLYTASDFIYEMNIENQTLSLINVEHQGYQENVMNSTIKELLGFTIWRDVDSVIDYDEEQEEDRYCFCTIS